MIELPFPHKALWPNGRAHYMAKSREVKKHRSWARFATLADDQRPRTVSGLIATFYPKPRGPVPDKDGCSASLKAYQDGIADAYGVDDRTFAEPRIIIGERCAEGKVVIDFETEARPIGEIIKPIMARLAEAAE